MSRRLKSDASEYVCPGEKFAISQAVHLGRLTRYYPLCRTCPRRNETGSLSVRHVEHLAKTRPRAKCSSWFGDEGAAGRFGDEFDATVARRMGVALGVYLLQQQQQSQQQQPRQSREHEGLEVVVATDGHPLAPELLAAAGEGLRWAGCRLIDLGAASGPCVAFAIDHLQADGGLLMGNPAGQLQAMGAGFWQAAQPLSVGGSLEKLRALFEAQTDRPTRKFGSIQRFSAADVYLADLAEHYHAMRPLRLVIASECSPVFGYFEKLTAPVACRVSRCRGGIDRLSPRVIEEKAHFGALIDEAGARFGLLDERAQPVSAERLLGLVVGLLLDTRIPKGPIVLEHDTPAHQVHAIRRQGVQIFFSSPRRAEMYHAMRTHEAIFGGGPSGRFWYRSATGHITADALKTITLLLILLSRSDRPVSEVLDACSPSR